MQPQEISQLDYNAAIKLIGEAITTPMEGELVVLDSACTKYLADSNTPATVRKFVTVGRIAKIDKGVLRILKLRSFYEDGSSCPESEEVEISAEIIKKSAADRIAITDDVFGTI